MNNDRSRPIRRFDFDNGYLTQSPCKRCQGRTEFPRCFDHCITLDRIQTILAQGVVTTYAVSPLEPYAVRLEEQKKG